MGIRSIAATVTLLLGLGVCGTALAQGTNEAVAEALFNEGRKLMEAERYDEACEKFRASHELDRATGTQLNLALCYKLAGRSASAWITYKAAAAAARQAGQADRQELALKEAKQLEADLIYLTIEVPDDSRVDGLALKLDGVVVPKASWGLEVPVDPGSHVLEAAAPAHEDWRHEFETADERSVIEVPTLSAAAEPESTSDPALDEGVEKAAPSASTSNVPAWIAFGVGGAGVIAGAVGFLGYRSAVQDLEKTCDARQRCPSSAEKDISREKTMRTLSLAGFVVGGIGLATGATLLVLSDGEQEAQAGHVEAYAGLGELGIRGNF